MTCQTHVYYPPASNACAYCGAPRFGSSDLDKRLGIVPAKPAPKPVTETDVAAGFAVGTLIGAAAVVGALVLAVIPKEDPMKKTTKTIRRCGIKTLHRLTGTSLVCAVIKGHGGPHYAQDGRGVGWTWTGKAGSLRGTPGISAPPGEIAAPLPAPARGAGDAPGGWSPTAFRAHVGFAVVEVTQKGCLWVWSATTADRRVKWSKTRHLSMEDAGKEAVLAACKLAAPPGTSAATIGAVRTEFPSVPSEPAKGHNPSHRVPKPPTHTDRERPALRRSAGKRRGA